MNGNEFDKIVNKVLDNTKSVLSSKASEYASSSNRMHNFAKCSKFNSLLCMGRNNNARALWALLAKHVASISDIVDDTTKDILGKSLIVHQGPDDYISQPSGNSGARVACSAIIK